MIDAGLLDLIPDDDPSYLTAVERCTFEGMHPAVAAIQAHVDLAHWPRHRTIRKDVA